MNPNLGIDFGTTKTLVSRYDAGKDKPRPVRLGRGIDYYVPTSVFIKKEDCFYFGADADDRRAMAPRNYRRTFKLDIGEPTYVLSAHIGEYKQKFTAADLTKKFLGYILQQCAEKSYPCDRAVVTRPVYFSPVQCEQLREAALAAGLKEVELLTEPQAAGLKYGCDDIGADWQNALVVDWGGGTLDMALISQSEQGPVAHGRYCKGIRSGGEDFDNILFQIVASEIRTAGYEQMLKADRDSLGWKYYVDKQIRKAKEDLSWQNFKKITLMSHEGKTYPPITVTRETFEWGIRSKLEEGAALAKNVIDSIQELSLKPSFILLVGGSSKIPAVRSVLKQATGLECRTFDEAEEAVSLGAALWAHNLWGCPETSPTQETSPEIPLQPSEPPQPTPVPLPVFPPPQPEPIPIPQSSQKSAPVPSPNLASQPKPAPKTQPSSSKDNSGRYMYIIGYLVLVGLMFYALIEGGDLHWGIALILAFLLGGIMLIWIRTHPIPLIIFIIYKVIKGLWFD